MPAESALLAAQTVRDTSHFQWNIITLLLLTLYVYFREAENGRWDRVLAGLAFWGMDGFNEIWNALLFHFSSFAPAWSAHGPSSYVILIGLNIEISLMFVITGVAATLAIPADPKLRWFGVNNRLWFAVVMSLLSVGVEMVLNRFGVLRWEWAGWGRGAPWLIFLVGYLPFYLVCYWVYDMPSRRRQVAVVASLLGADALAFGIFVWLGWI